MTATEAEVTAVHAPGATPKLNKALSQLQGELPQIKKTKTAEVKDQQGNRVLYTYNYADLGDVVADVGPLLAKYGLAFHCAPTINPADRREMIMSWALLHESGEEKAGEWPLGPAAQKPQSLGSAITYGRRYCFTAATNIVLEDDDDGQRAQQDHGTRQSAGDAWENSTPARPRQDRKADRSNGTPADDQWYVRPEPNPDAATPEDTRPWAEVALEQAGTFKTESEGIKLWREAAARALDGECSPGQKDHIQNRVNARILDRRREASDRILRQLSETDDWRAKVEELRPSDDETAKALLDEIGQMKAAGTMNEQRAGRIGRAIIALCPKAALDAAAVTA